MPSDADYRAMAGQEEPERWCCVCNKALSPECEWPHDACAECSAASDTAIRIALKNAVDWADVQFGNTRVGADAYWADAARAALKSAGLID